MQGPLAECAECTYGLRCYKGRSDCPTSVSLAVGESLAAYGEQETLRLSQHAARVEAQGYRVWDRAFETAEFAARMGYRHLGLAFCVALRREAAMYYRYLAERGFRVTSVMCKTGAIPKEQVLGLADDEKVRPGSFEAMCNPIAQARFLANARVDLNVIIGLCVGHDSLFIQHAVGPVTCLVAKDRVYDHKPVEAIRSRASGEIPATLATRGAVTPAEPHGDTEKGFRVG